MLINIKDSLFYDIKLFCKVNNINDYEKVINNLLYKGLMTTKYGINPTDNKKIEKQGTDIFSDLKLIPNNEKENIIKSIERKREEPLTESTNENNEKDLLSEKEAKTTSVKKTRIIKRKPND